ncbi:dynactin, subunit p25 [Saitoella complicata NRRL Y-17804]|uniref:Dynactin subunit 5 n=1 Tax=Saitoella complicata (strain BCRC 22490 / CBS 7301 / JCM 7358 / NBRC 10748 / NRRL Y-17804) TaxID=698492 RepID=A0A0E9NCD6_SAICN|nr:dynactin, subunit p25 [Saitoella complicata NRRL Y-17804]ODQ52689.1 dynactin, subunit p25 [Saitoella complicata NRRL Y-17804]GAO47463.1 hypothetical protein G7K_1670-t1 [Saitoella complicata NRRL Y-17804]
MASSQSGYIITDTGNKVSRKAEILGLRNIVLGGKTIIKPNVQIRGDLVRVSASGGGAISVAIGRYCLLDDGCLIKPPAKPYKGQLSYYPIKIGDHVHIGANTTIEAAQIGSNVIIGKNCIIGKFAIIKDCVRIDDNTHIPAGMVIPPLSLVSARRKGGPKPEDETGRYAGVIHGIGEVVEELPEVTQLLIDAETRDFYTAWKPEQ